MTERLWDVLSVVDVQLEVEISAKTLKVQDGEVVVAMQSS